MEQLCLKGRTPSTAHLKFGVFARLLYGKSLTVGKQEAKVKSHQLFLHFKWLWKSGVSHRIGGALPFRHSCSIYSAHRERGYSLQLTVLVALLASARTFGILLRMTTNFQVHYHDSVCHHLQIHA